jgi:hypothetical protein
MVPLALERTCRWEIDRGVGRRLENREHHALVLGRCQFLLREHKEGTISRTTITQKTRTTGR